VVKQPTLLVLLVHVHAVDRVERFQSGLSSKCELLIKSLYSRVIVYPSVMFRR
jgi:hypothetical protein